MAYSNIDADYIAGTFASKAAGGVVQINGANSLCWKANYCSQRNANVPLLIGMKCTTEGPTFNTVGTAFTISINGGSYTSVSLASSYELDYYAGGVTRASQGIIIAGSYIYQYYYRMVFVIPASALGNDHITQFRLRYTEADGSYYNNNSSNTQRAVVFVANSYANDAMGNLSNYNAIADAGTYSGAIPDELTASPAGAIRRPILDGSPFGGGIL